MPSSTSISADLVGGLASLEAAVANARAAPLSSKKAMLAVLLADALVDRLSAATTGEDDILVFRTAVAASSPSLGLILDLAAMRPGGARLAIEAVAVPIENYARLAVEDFMVSVYNDNSVQRLLVATPDGSRHDAHAMLADAVAVLRERLPR